jgi:CRP-like cAMP-binding protein
MTTGESESTLAWRSLSGGFLDILGPEAPHWRQKMRRRRFARDEVIFHEGELGDTVHVLDKGRVLVEVLFVPVEKRVFRVLDRLAARFDTGETPIVIRLRQEDIAAMAGTRRQTANRPLKSAEARGIVRIGRGRIEVVDPAALSALAR